MKTNQIVGALILLGIIGLIGYLIPITLVLGNQEILNPTYTAQLNLFQGLLFFGLIATAVLYGTFFILKKDDKYTNSFGFFNIGEVFPFFKRFSAFQLTLGFAIIFSIIFLVTNLLQVGGFTSSKVLPQQFSPADSLLFSTLLIPASEEIMAMALTGFLVLGLILASLKYKITRTEFLTYYLLLIPIIIGLFAVVWHNSAYANSDIGLIIVFMFWTIKTFLNLAVGFFVVGWLLHINNNFFIDFPRLFSSDVVLISTISVIIGLIALYIFLYKDRLFGSSQKQEVILS